MKKTLATAATLLALIGSAYAATMEGVVQSVDPATRTITLETGQSFVAAEGIPIEALQTGTKIKVTVDDSTGAVTQIEQAS